MLWCHQPPEDTVTGSLLPLLSKRSSERVVVWVLVNPQYAYMGVVCRCTFVRWPYYHRDTWAQQTGSTCTPLCHFDFKQCLSVKVWWTPFFRSHPVAKAFLFHFSSTPSVQYFNFCCVHGVIKSSRNGLQTWDLVSVCWQHTYSSCVQRCTALFLSILRRAGSALRLALSPQPSFKLYCGFLPTIHQSKNHSDWNKVLSFHPKMLKHNVRVLLLLFYFVL